jgi:hypothetical protein
VKTRTVLVAAAPLLLLILLSLLFRFLPIALGGAATETERLTGTDLLPSPPPRLKPQPLDAETKKAVEKVVSGQLTALQKRDFAAALTFAMPDFRSEWTPERFGQMIADGYASLLTSKKWKFGTAESFGSDVQIHVTVTGAKRKQGKWYVNGCSPATPPLTISGGNPPVKREQPIVE